MLEDTVLSHLFSNVGVPAAICFYVLVRVNQTLKELTTAINTLNTDLDKRIRKLERRMDEVINHDTNQPTAVDSN